MNVRRYIAATARDALRKVKDSLGPDAIILSNRSVPAGVEIMAVSAREISMLAPSAARDEAPRQDDFTVRLSPTASQLSPTTGQSSPTTGQSSPTARQMSPTASQSSASPAPASPAPPAAVDAPPRAAAATRAPALSPRLPPKLDPLPPPPERPAEVVPAEVMDEIRALRRIVEQHLAGFAWGESARSEPVKTEVLRQLLDSGFSPQLARQLLAELPPQLGATAAMGHVRSAAERILLTTGSGNDIIDRGGVYALVGPTGVGKTTTTAKLAARCVLRHGAAKVALVTTDGYRIGAHEQLRIYGRILGVPVHLVKDRDDLRLTLNELRHKHMVLVDTMGMSQRDRLVGEQIAMFGESGVKRLLLLPATGRGDTLDDVVRAYNGPDLAGCIVTKVDEAASLAPSLDVIMRHALCLHYISNGQRVPEDLHLPNRSYLLHRAFKEAPEASPHRFDGVEPRLVMANAGGAVAGVARG